MARFDLTDFGWDVIRPLLPTKLRGVRRAHDRRMLNAIFWRLPTGARPGRTFRRARAPHHVREPL
jgi:transposase